MSVLLKDMLFGIGVSHSCSDRLIEVAWQSSMPSVVNELRVGSLTVGFSGVWKCLHDYPVIMPFHLFDSQKVRSGRLSTPDNIPLSFLGFLTISWIRSRYPSVIIWIYNHAKPIGLTKARVKHSHFYVKNNAVENKSLIKNLTEIIHGKSEKDVLTVQRKDNKLYSYNRNVIKFYVQMFLFMFHMCLVSFKA